jgi:endonuclease G
MVRRSKGSRRRGARLGNAFLYLNLVVAVILGGWYSFQSDGRQAEVRRLVGNAFKSEKHVSALNVAWDVWQLYYSDSATGQVVGGDKTIVYGAVPSTTAPGTTIKLLTNHGYIVGYNDLTGSPAWVAYHVRDLAKIPVPAPRPEKFEVDRRTVSRVSSEIYAASGYDRGHLAPNYAIATRYGAEAQRETFLMSNITPQRHALNAGLWKELEMKIATSYPARYGEVWVFAGPIFDGSFKKLKGKVPIPDAFFMIIVDEQEGKLRTLSLIVPQEADASSGIDRYLTTISEIQRRTQLDFFSDLDDVSEKQIESVAATRVW